MPLLAIILGALLDLVGVAGFVLTDMRSWTALIPSIFGTVLLVLGVLAMVRPGLRKHLMHAAMLVCLVGLVGSGRMLLKSSGSGEPAPEPHIEQVRVAANGLTAGVCIVFLGFGVRSFIEARRKRAV